MSILLVLEMAVSGFGDRVAVTSEDGNITYAELMSAVQDTAAELSENDGHHVAMLGEYSDMVPTLMFACAAAGKAFVPLNYRLTDDQLDRALAALDRPLVFCTEDTAGRVAAAPGRTIKILSPVRASGQAIAPPTAAADTDAAVVLFTSGTSGSPKAAVLAHGNLTAYVLSTVEFMSAAQDESILVSVPPYHIAGISSVLTSMYAGRRMVLLPHFDPHAWVEFAAREAVTQAMVVPTMLRRILEALEETGTRLPALRLLSYGGGRMPVSVIERAMAMLPDVAFVNAYGLTETSSTIALLGPEDHRRALSSEDSTERARLGSVGQPLPGMTIEIRTEDGRVAAVDEVGSIRVRGDQVSGQYLTHRAVDDEGWFETRDVGWLDSAGYLFLGGRQDDVIVRGGENLSPGEIEDTLLEHPAVHDVAVLGVPDDEWGEVVAAAVVLSAGVSATERELQDWTRQRLRSARTPAYIRFFDELPYNSTGKLVRRELRDGFATAEAEDS